jgi:hypothetical protein
MRKQLYLDIQNKLSAITGENNASIFKHFDLWNQNVKFLEEDSPFDRPACFVEFLPLVWQTVGLRVQEANLTIRLHIVTDWFAQTAKYNPAQVEALTYLDLPDAVVAAMQSIAVNGTNCLMRTRSVINHNHGKYVDSVEEYTALITDTSALQSSGTTVTLTPKITATFQ